MARKEDSDCKARLNEAVDAFAENQSTDHDSPADRAELKKACYKGSMKRCDPNEGVERYSDCDYD